jgi:hypothetical protein
MGPTEKKEGPGATDQPAGKAEPITTEQPADKAAAKGESYGFKLGKKKILQMTITATEINRVGNDEGGPESLMEVRYHLRWEGVTGQGMEKDITIRFVQDTPEGTEEIILQQEMMALMLEAKRRYVS